MAGRLRIALLALVLLAPQVHARELRDQGLTPRLEAVPAIRGPGSVTTLSNLWLMVTNIGAASTSSA